MYSACSLFYLRQEKSPAMKIRKREQIVIGVISAIAVIAALHIMIFQPNTRDYKTSRAELAQKQQQMQNMKRLTSPQKLEQYNETSAKLLELLREGINDLGLDRNEVFLLPDRASVPEPENADELSPDEIFAIKVAKYEEMVGEKRVEQVTALLDEVKTLSEFAQDTTLDLKFLGTNAKGWRLPTELPNQMQQTDEIWDLIAKIADTKGTLEVLQNPEIQRQRRQGYLRDVQRLGMRPDYTEALKQFGEFVPLYYQLAFVNLVLDRLSAEPNDILILQEKLDREMLLKLLEVEISFDALPDNPSDTKSYFAFEAIHNINKTLELMKEKNIPEVTTVEVGAYGFLQQMPRQLKPPPGVKEENGDEEEQEGGAKPSVANRVRSVLPTFTRPGAGGGPAVPGMMNRLGSGRLGGNQAEGEEGESPYKRKESDIGYAIPITFTFRADNKTLWEFTYDLLRNNPLAELDGLKVTSLGASNRLLSETGEDVADLLVELRVIYVIQLFGTMETVKELETLDADADAGTNKNGRPQMPTAPSAG